MWHAFVQVYHVCHTKAWHPMVLATSFHVIPLRSTRGTLTPPQAILRRRSEWETYMETIKNMWRVKFSRSAVWIVVYYIFFWRVPFIGFLHSCLGPCFGRFQTSNLIFWRIYRNSDLCSLIAAFFPIHGYKVRGTFSACWKTWKDQQGECDFASQSNQQWFCCFQASGGVSEHLGLHVREPRRRDDTLFKWTWEWR